jgi:thymidylate kinase
MAADGLFVVCEGADKAGKTTVIKNAQSILVDKVKTFYNKGLGGNGFLGRTARNYPCTFLFLLQQLHFDKTSLNKLLNQNYVVFQDRWFYSVISYPGNSIKDSLIADIMVPPLRRPDLLVYFTCSLEERLKRLELDKTKEHLDLINHPEKIIAWESNFLNYYSQFHGKKYLFDTTNESVYETSMKLSNIIQNKGAILRL